MSQKLKTIMGNPKKEFSGQWWNKFLELSENLTKPTSINNAFSDNTSDQMLEKTMDVFRSFDDAAIFRIWVNGKERNDLNKVLMENPPTENDTLESWTTEIFGKEKFGIIFNEGECWNKELNIDIFKKIKPLLEKAGYPMMGMDLTFFIGNYGWTPLGIHIDYLGESVMHFHLGPAKKEMYLWDKKVYLEDMKGVINENRPEFFLNKATKYEINKGGIFYMPWGMPHVGKSDELSVGISIWFNKPTEQKILKKITDNFNSEYISKGKNFDREHNSFINTSEEIKILDYKKDPLSDLHLELIQNFKNIDLLNKTSYIDLLKMGTMDYQYSLKSSLNFSAPLTFKKDAVFEITKESYAALDYPYKIEWYHSETSGKIHLFIKGQKIMMNYSKDIVELINRLNKSKINIVSDLIQGLFVDLPEEVAIRIIEILHENSGVIIKNSLDSIPVNQKKLNNALIATK